MKILYLLLAVSFSLISTVYAATNCRAFVTSLSQRYALKIGDPVEIELTKNGQAESATVSFLGLGVAVDGTYTGAYFFNADKMRIDFIPISSVEFIVKADLKRISPELIAPVAQSFNQEGGTCAAYAIFNCFHQLYVDGHIGNGMLSHHMKDEMARQRFAMRIAMDYYGDGDYTGTESKAAKDLGFEIGAMDTRNARAMQTYIQDVSAKGWPMLLFFRVAQTMSQTPYVIVNHATDTESDRRLWLPRDSGSDHGGHQILLVKSFVDTLNREWLLTVDSNWQAPRLWSSQELNKLSSGGLGGWALWQVAASPLDLPPAPRTPFLVEPDPNPMVAPPNF